MLAGVRVIAAALAMVSVSFAAVAQAIPPGAQIVPPSDQPGRERERFAPPVAPLARPGGPIIAVPGIEAPPGAAQTALVIRSIRITGATVYTSAQLAELYADLIGERVTLQQVYELAGRITAKYGADGYVLSRAIIPVQELDPNGAVVHIQVLEGYIETVEWPAELAGYRDFFSYYAARITAERPVNIRTIERYLLLAGDLPGLKFKNSIKPHPTKVGAAILVVEVTQRKPVDLFGRIDNRGTHARGPLEFLGSVTANNWLHLHEAITLTAAGAFQTQELQFYNALYRQVLTAEGLTFFASASYGYGRPDLGIGQQFLLYKTKSLYAESGVIYPVIRSRERNLNVAGLFFASDDNGSFFDMPDTPPSTLDRLRGFRLRAEGDNADSTGATNQFFFVLSQGIQGWGSTENGSDLASRANGKVDFTKMELTLSRLQPLFDQFSVLLAGYGQYALTPLLVSELCGYGGRVFGRAFDPSQFVSDSCAEVLAELRYDIPLQLKGLSLAQLYGFADHGWLHNIAPVPGTFSNVDAASVGAGLRLGWLNAITADLSVAQAVQGTGLLGTGTVPGLLEAGPRKNTRFFFILNARL
ncbi:MAG: POTRA domain-containing protein [Xanthobacteraceae bacterium]